MNDKKKIRKDPFADSIRCIVNGITDEEREKLKKSKENEYYLSNDDTEEATYQDLSNDDTEEATYQDSSNDDTENATYQDRIVQLEADTEKALLEKHRLEQLVLEMEMKIANQEQDLD